MTYHSYHLNSSLALLLPSSVNSISVSPANPYPNLELPAYKDGLGSVNLVFDDG